MRKQIEDIIHDRDIDNSALLLKTALSLLEGVYTVAIDLRNFLYNKNILKSSTLPVRIVSVGNLTVGGTGKTPVVIMIAKKLLNDGMAVAVVSRGYKGDAKEPVIVSDGVTIKSTSVEAGDEALIMANELPGVPIVVGKDRVKAAQLACDTFKPSVILLDDGFQHRRLDRIVDIVTVNADNPFGNAHLLPRGILREPPYSLSRAKAVLITRFHDGHKKEKLERMTRFFDRRVPIFWCGHNAVGLRKPGTTDRLPLDMLKDKKIAALSNIANPESFHHLLDSLGADTVSCEIKPDHYRYDDADMKQIGADAVRAGAEILVMTAKDERNLPGMSGVEGIESYVLDIEAVMVGDDEEFYRLIKPKKWK